MIHADVIEFIRNGNFGPIAIGVSESNITDALNSSGVRLTEPNFEEQLIFGCLQIGIAAGRANWLNLVFSEGFPSVSDAVMIQTHGIPWSLIRKHDLWMAFKRLAPDLLPKKDIVKGLRKTCAIRVGQTCSLFFERKDVDFYLVMACTFQQ